MSIRPRRNRHDPHKALTLETHHHLATDIKETAKYIRADDENHTPSLERIKHAPARKTARYRITE